jgi:hypothetical protein
MPNLFLRLSKNKDEEREREVGFVAVGAEPIPTAAKRRGLLCLYMFVVEK